MIDNFEVFATVLFYTSDEGKDYRTTKKFTGKVKDLVSFIKEKPIDDFMLNYYVGTSSSIKDFIELAKHLEHCFELGKPYANNMY